MALEAMLTQFASAKHDRHSNVGKKELKRRMVSMKEEISKCDISLAALKASVHEILNIRGCVHTHTSLISYLQCW